MSAQFPYSEMGRLFVVGWYLWYLAALASLVTGEFSSMWSISRPLWGRPGGSGVAAGRCRFWGSNFDFWSEWNRVELHGTTELTIWL